MSQNPYASPAPTFTAADIPTTVYRPANRLVLGLTIALATLMICDGLITVVTGVAEIGFPGLMEKESYEPTEAFVVMGLGAGMVFGGLGLMAAFLASVILFCVTIHRLNKNARALGSKGMEFTPGWSVGWFFIPIANLFKPYQAVREIYQASDPRAGEFDWRQSPVLAPLGFWWGAWIVGNIVDNIEARITWRQMPISPEISLIVSIVSLGLTVVAGVLAIYVIRAIHARQQEKSANRLAKPPIMTTGTGNAFT